MEFGESSLNHSLTKDSSDFYFNNGVDKFNNEDVFLKLEERVADTSTFKLYKQEKYLLKRSFTNDFDF